MLTRITNAAPLCLTRIARRGCGMQNPLETSAEGAEHQSSARQRKFSQILQEEIGHIAREDMTKFEVPMSDNRMGKIRPEGEEKLFLNFISNDFFSLNQSPDLIHAGQSALDTHGAGLGSVRFICGTQDIHKNLEKQIAEFHHQEDCILYASGYSANVGLCEALLGPNDAVVFDEGNGPAILDGIRLSKARQYHYEHLNLEHLDDQLQRARDDGADLILVMTQGAFPYTSDLAPLKEIGQICHEHHAMLAVDDSHAVGLVGGTGRGTPEFFGVMDKVHIINSTFNHVFGGAGGGYTAGCPEVIDLLRQRARPYLFSNSLSPAAVSIASKAFEQVEHNLTGIQLLAQNAKLFRSRLRAEHFEVRGENLPMCPVFVGDHRLAEDLASELYEQNILTQPIAFPYVPNDQALLRFNMNVSHSIEEIERTTDAIIEIGKTHDVWPVRLR